MEFLYKFTHGISKQEINIQVGLRRRKNHDIRYFPPRKERTIILTWLVQFNPINHIKLWMKSPLSASTSEEKRELLVNTNNIHFKQYNSFDSYT